MTNSLARACRTAAADMARGVRTGAEFLHEQLGPVGVASAAAAVALLLMRR